MNPKQFSRAAFPVDLTIGFCKHPPNVVRHGLIKIIWNNGVFRIRRFSSFRAHIQMFKRERACRMKDQRAFNNIAKLPDIARPVVVHKHVNSAGGQGRDSRQFLRLPVGKIRFHQSLLFLLIIVFGNNILNHRIWQVKSSYLVMSQADVFRICTGKRFA